MTEPHSGQEKPLAPENKVMVQAEGDADEDIPHPTLEVYRHTLLRGANLGAVLSLAFGPPVLFIRGVRQPSEIFRRLAGVCVKGVGIGMGFAAVMTIARLWNSTDEQTFDRAYRLCYNKGQVRMDKFTYGGALLAGVAGAAAGGLKGSVQGASIGVGLAVLVHVVTNPKQK